MPLFPFNDSVESFARSTLSVVLGADFTEVDDGTVHRAVDGVFNLSNGRDGALEVTIVGDQRQLEAMAASDFAYADWGITATRYRWFIQLPAKGTRIKQAKPILQRLIPLVEELETRTIDPALIPDGFSERDRNWIINNCRRIYAFPNGEPGVEVIVYPEMGGWVNQDPGMLSEWLNNNFDGDHLGNKISKLEKREVSERHLFLFVDDTADTADENPFPYPARHQMMNGEQFRPAGDLDRLPEAITDVWVTTRWINSTFRWSRGSGWRHISHDELNPDRRRLGQIRQR